MIILVLHYLKNLVPILISTREKGNGRTETRLSFVTQDTSVLGDIALDWLGLTTVGIVGSIRQVGDLVPQDITLKYYTSSVKLKRNNY